MKINKILLGAFALSMTFASCSNDEPAKGGSNNTVTNGEKYMAVKIKSVGNPASRADREFEDPVGEEGTITKDNIRFYFFTAEGLPLMMSTTGLNGTVKKTNMVKPFDVKPGNTDGGATEIEAVLVLGTVDEEGNGHPYEGNRPAKVFCVANATDEATFEKFADVRLKELLNIEPFNTPGEWSKFRMTSSTYLSGNTIVYYTDVTNNVKETKDEAMRAPAEIYLERLAAKIRVNGLGEYPVLSKDKDGNMVTTPVEYELYDGSEAGSVKTTLKVELQGWRTYMTANRAYAIKKIDASWTDDNLFKDWNKPELHRCYWAEDPGLTQLNDNTYNIYEASQFTLGNYNKAKPTENIKYVYENTLTDAILPASVTDRTTNATAILVRGVVKRADNNTAVDMVQWGGDYYLASYWKQRVLDAYNEGKDPTNQATIDQVEFVPDTYTKDAPANTYCCKIDGNVYNRFNFQYWKNGVTSYFVNIEHLGKKFGVVRNHIYDYTFTNVIGLGVPGNDPKNPEKNKETYLAASVYCLNWHISSNSLVLE